MSSLKYSGFKILAVIPARSGSKRLPKKNTLLLGGKPLVEWTIQAAKDSGCFSNIVVSSDDNLVLEIARRNKVDIVVRDPELATDTAKSVDVVKNVINIYKEEKGVVFDIVVLLQPTSPLRSADDIYLSINKYIERNARSVVSMTKVQHSPLYSCELGADDDLNEFYSSLKKLPSRSQDLPNYFRLNGAVYVVNAADFIEQGSFFISPGVGYIMPDERSVDIDSEFDFLLCKSLVDFNVCF